MSIPLLIMSARKLRKPRVPRVQRVQGILVALVFTVIIPVKIFAAPYYPELTYRYEHHLMTLNPNEYPLWRKTEEVWQYGGTEIKPAAILRSDGDNIPPLPEGVTRSLRTSWNKEAIAATIATRITTIIDRPRGTVSIDKNEEGEIVFEGVGFRGRTVDTAKAAMLTITALDTNVTDIHLPVREEQPVIHVLHPDLQDRGIAEVIAIGESDFSHSATSRRHNIATGVSKFNGHIIPQGEVFSFNEVLGPVNGETGYVKELVILGDKTLPDYGGGLCQVSTTAYRGVWEYGFPIVQRRNHSFAVQYYAPQGTDATIYPPYTDIKFLNDSPGDLLIQTHINVDKAYFIYYGTKDNRDAEVIGPYVWDKRSPPADRIEYTTDLPQGVKKKVGSAVSGMQAAWFRIVRTPDSEESIEPFYSYYEARPNFTQIGGAPKAPSWLGE
ncbi:hypothetical protein COU75_01665, partial [Candidatus Peregrinibacteria bacterium CG10_big_fil_rev_8_21_14_0_10_42_8]